MNEQKSLADTSIAKIAGLAPESTTLAALELRRNVIEMTETAAEAVLNPTAPGGISVDLRATIACRAARINAHKGLEEHFAAMIADPEHMRLSAPGATCDQADLAAILSFVDKITETPRDASAADIAGLQAAGVADADIVRVSELLAFLAYQYRLIVGLALMEAAA